MKITSIEQLDKNALYTYADYGSWRFEQMVELIKGKLFILSPAPASRHQSILSGLAAQILPHFIKTPCKSFLAPFDVRLIKEKKEDKDIVTVVQPDICVICDASKIDERGCLGSPDWIIEILSPATAKKDYNEKFNLYEENGVREYWVVNPDANVVDQYVLDESGKYYQKELYKRTQII
ncbi:MAG TPA: Uma2 family endonuclease, partial [Ferruginibacter sp.]|nr:Uma2 family endonuclease [Ferruginibacter sp.]